MIAMVVLYFHQFYAIRSYYVEQEESFKAKTWKRICKRQLPSDKLSTRNPSIICLQFDYDTHRRDDN